MTPEEARTLLGVKADTNQLEIRKKYLKLALTVHPDKKGGSVEAFQNLSNAYHALQKHRSRSSSRSSRRSSSRSSRRSSPPSPPPPAVPFWKVASLIALAAALHAVELDLRRRSRRKGGFARRSQKRTR